MKFKKFIKKGVVLFLTLFLFISIPVNAFAESADYSFKELFCNYYKNGQVVSKSLTSLTNGATIADTSVPANDIISAGVKFNFVNTVNSNNYQIAFITAHTRYKAMRVKLYDDRNVVVKDFYAVRGETTDNYDFYQEQQYNVIFILKCTMPRSGVYTLEFSEFQLDANYQYMSFGMSSFSVGIKEQDTNSLLDGIIDFLKSILEGIKNIPNSIGNFITSLGSQISGFFSNLTNNLSTWFSNIGKWFTDLGNNIKTWFTNLTNNLKTWFDNIGDWFTELGNDISSWFNKLFNKLWWGNENGEAAYQPPVFSSGLTDVIKKLDDYCDSLDDTLAQIDNSKNVASDYIKQGTGVINQALGVMPSAVIVLITFGIVFIFSRKVVGR